MGEYDGCHCFLSAALLQTLGANILSASFKDFARNLLLLSLGTHGIVMI